MKSNLCAFDASKAFAKYDAMYENGTATLKRAFKQTRRAVHNFADDAAFVVKKQPFKVVGAAFGAAFILGAVAGRFARK